MRWLIVPLVFVASWIVAAPVQAARLALVIGINDYQMIPPLQKAVGDAEAMSATLTELGFEVTTVLNPDRRAFNRAITRFRKSLRPGDVAFVHFSGHGIEVEGRNLLLPSDMPLPTRNDEDFLVAEAIDLTSLMGRIADSGAGVRIFVVDACRENPFARRGVRGLGGVGGLAPVVPSRGSFILYSAGYAQTALDRLGPDDTSPTSVYTRVLVDKLGTPGASISEVARDVRTEVAALARSAGHDQFPAYYDELTEDVVLVPAAPEEAAAPALLGAVAEPERIVQAFAKRQLLQRLWAEGAAHERAGDDIQHFRRMNEARLIATAEFGINSEEYAIASNHVVGALTKMGRLKDAIEASGEAVRVFSALFGEHDPRVLNEKANLADRLALAGRTGEAAEILESLVAVLDAEQPRGNDRLAHAHVLQTYSRLLMLQGEAGAAERHAARAYELLDQAGITDMKVGSVVGYYASVLSQNGKCESAQAMYRRAADEMEAARVSETQQDHAGVLAALAAGCR